MRHTLASCWLDRRNQVDALTELGGVSGRTLWLAPASGNVAAAEVGLRKASEVCGGSIPAPHADWRIMEGPRTGVLTSWRVFGQAADQNARQRPKTSKGGSLLDLLPAAWVLVIWLSDGSCTLGETWAVWSAKKRAQRVGPDGTRQNQVGTLPAPPRAALPAPHAPAHARLLLLLLRSRRPESVAIAPKYKTGACGAACAELALCAVLTQVLCCLVGFDIAPNHPHAPLARIAAAPPGRQPGHAPPVPASANTLALHNHEQAHVLLSRSYPLGWVMCAKGQKGYGQTPHNTQTSLGVYYLNARGTGPLSATSSERPVAPWPPGGCSERKPLGTWPAITTHNAL